MVNGRVYLDCGCCAWIGVRVDNHEAATAIGSCSPEHRYVVEHFHMLLLESLAEPTGEDLIVVADRLLESTARFYGLGD
jgi:hypothetical protein